MARFPRVEMTTALLGRSSGTAQGETVSGPLHSVSEGSGPHGLCHGPKGSDRLPIWGLGSEPWDGRKCGILVLVHPPECWAGG